MTHFDDAVARLSQISWGELRSPVSKVHAALLRTYFQNAASFLNTTGSSVDVAFFNAADVVGVSHQELPSDADQLLERIAGSSPALTHAISRWFLAWAVVRDRVPEVTQGFGDLYSPLIEIMERGVSFVGIRKAELIFGEEELSVPLQSWKNA